MKVTSNKADALKQPAKQIDDLLSLPLSPTNDFQSDYAKNSEILQQQNNEQATLPSDGEQPSADNSSLEQSLLIQQLNINPLLEQINLMREKQTDINLVEGSENSLPEANANNTVDDLKQQIQASTLNTAVKDIKQQALDYAFIANDISPAIDDKAILSNSELSAITKKLASMTSQPTQPQISDTEMKQVLSSIVDADIKPILNNNLNLQNEFAQSDQTVDLGTIYGSPDKLTSPQLDNGDKYADALVQLGGFINAQTMREALNPTTTKVNQQAAFADSLNDIKQKETGLDIELIRPTTNNALMNDSYQANIKIYPPELGRVIATLKVDNKHATLMIRTENDRVKEIIETHLSQLKANFQRADINLTIINIEVQQPNMGSMTQDQASSRRQAYQPTELDRQTNELNQSATTEKPIQRLNSLIDTYA